MLCQPVSSGTGQGQILVDEGQSKVRVETEPDMVVGLGKSLPLKEEMDGCHSQRERAAGARS